MGQAGSDVDVMGLIAHLRRRLRRADDLRALACGLITVAGATGAAGGLLGAPAAGLVAGVGIAVIIGVATALRSCRVWTAAAVAAHTEALVPGLDNLLFSAVELETSTGARHPLSGEVRRQAAERAGLVRPDVVAPLGLPAMLVLVAALGAGAVVWVSIGDGRFEADHTPVATADASIEGLRFEVQPPDYLGSTAGGAIEDPSTLTLLAGSTLRLEVRATTRQVWVAEAGQENRVLVPGGNGHFTGEWQPRQTSTLAVAGGDGVGEAVDTRLVTVNVMPDTPPRVRVASPGHDLAFSSAPAVIDLEVDAQDEQALAGLQLRYTRLSGSGESFEFTEGHVPLTVERESPQQWVARGRWQIGDLGLGDGDAVIYRALARDANPDADWVASESYTVEVGKRLEAAAGGFALADDEGRYAISQQMVILKTERLQARRGELDPAAWTDETALLATEQRMVRAEVVFLSGGEIEDEIVEAAQADELQEGRLENRGRAEMLRAVGEMSRAEARLIAGDTAGALVFERAALAALQRAFDRRRYFLRTLPERARIDATRRLSGDRRLAQSFSRPDAPAVSDALTAERDLMADLSAVVASGQRPPASVLARLASLDPQAGAWRDTAAALSAAATVDARRDAARTAMARVAARARAALPPTFSAPHAGPLTGLWADERRMEAR